MNFIRKIFSNKKIWIPLVMVLLLLLVPVYIIILVAMAKTKKWRKSVDNTDRTAEAALLKYKFPFNVVVEGRADKIGVMLLPNKISWTYVSGPYVGSKHDWTTY